MSVYNFFFYKRRKHYPVPKEYQEYFNLSKYHLRGKGYFPLNCFTLFKEETKKEGEAEEEVQTQNGWRCGHLSRGNNIVLNFYFINNN